MANIRKLFSSFRDTRRKHQFEKPVADKNWGAKSMAPKFDARAPKTESSSVKAKNKHSSFAPSVNQIFVAVFLLLAAGAVFALFFSTGADERTVTASSSPTTTTQIPTLVSGHEAPSAKDVCRCYKSAFSLAASGSDVQSAAYSGGFLQCRRSFGVAGGDAWTAGWQDKQNRRTFAASCRKFR